MRWLKTLLTKDDNQTFDEIKVGAFIVILAASAALLNGSWICVWLIFFKGQKEFDVNAYLGGVNSYLTGCAAVLAAGAVGMGARDFRRRDDPPPQQGDR